jgi:hypothetical protein
MQVTIEVKDGYWTYNGKPLVNCTFPEKQVVSRFIKNYVFNIDINTDMRKKECDLKLSEHNYDFDFVKL